MNIDQINSFHSSNINVTNKIITLIGEINEERFENFIKNMIILNQTNGGILIYLNTLGGDVSYGRAIYDTIKSSSNFVTIVCVGEVQSCGTLILMAGDIRIMTESSKLLLHSGHEGLGENHPRNIDQQYKALREDEQWMTDVYKERINEKRRKDKKKMLTSSQICDSITWDTFYSPKEALSLGLITKIGHTI